MGYFDGLASSGFQKNAEGQTLFFPNGKLGKGYVINETQQKELTSFLKTYYMITLPVIIISSIFLKFYSLILLIIVLPLYYLQVHKILGNAQKSTEKFSIAENAENIGKSMGKGTSIALLIVDVILLLVSIPLAINKETRLVGIFSILFWGLGLFVFIKYLKAALKDK